MVSVYIMHYLVIIILGLSTQASESLSFMQHNAIYHSPSQRQRKSIQLNSMNDELSWDNDANKQRINDELLLQMNLSIQNTNDDVMEEMRTFLRSFPFAAILPVQPLTYVPSDDGVKVTFLRKKTQEKGSVDGGIRIGVNFADDNNASLCLIATRNAEGQAVQKVFSEKIIIIELVKRIDSLQTDLDFQIESVFHRWM